ncbi:hypothetical protein [Nocardioides sp. CFH 31398]|uniref:hypothetical protein n=1 Tax=Nocardioides sp. CFH 31398 TaxID=2919579 RepID=UPI001F05181D|nr:hypothetical protein [Nocardioides sp. CFH 31398]MCH1867881.1 hypothetical protein [Nocardioides sp. CFH 31398]
MVVWLQLTVVALSLAVAVLAGVYLVPDRRPDRWLLGLTWLLEVVLVVQLVVGIALLVTESPDISVATFVGYLVGCLLLPPVAAWWARGEPSRSGTAVLVVLGVTVPFLVLRMQQVWDPAWIL